MRHIPWSVICIACIAIGCGDGISPIPTAPGTTSSTGVGAPPTAAPSPAPTQPTDGVLMAVGEIVSSLVTADDPLCSADWPYRCRRFRVRAPRDGLFEVVMTCPSAAHAYVVDIGVIDPAGRTWSPPMEQLRLGAQRSVKLPVTAGATYVVEIWSISAPGEVFELTSSLQPR